MIPAILLSKSLQSISYEVLNTLTQCKYKINAMMLQIKIHKVALGSWMELGYNAMKIIFIDMGVDFSCCNTFMTKHVLYCS